MQVKDCLTAVAARVDEIARFLLLQPFLFGNPVGHKQQFFRQCLLVFSSMAGRFDKLIEDRQKVDVQPDG